MAAVVDGVPRGRRGATLLTAAALAAPVRGQSESVGVAPTFFVRFAPAVAPVNLVYLGRRYVGLRGT